MIRLFVKMRIASMLFVKMRNRLDTEWNGGDGQLTEARPKKGSARESTTPDVFKKKLGSVRNGPHWFASPFKSVQSVQVRITVFH